MNKARGLLRALLAEVVAREGTLAVALTGSLARGDATAGSDVDLWVVSSDNGREDWLRDDVAVSLLITSEAYARSLECALRFETQSIEVLHDPRGILREVCARARDEAALIERELRLHATAVFARLGAVLRGEPPPLLELATLRELARRAAALFLWQARGLRVPKWRHFSEVLYAEDLAHLQRALSLGDVDEKAALAGLEGVRDATLSREWPWPSPAELRRYLCFGRREDAVLALRQSLPPLPDVDEEGLSGPTRALFRIAHGVASDDEARLRGGPAREATRALVERFSLARALVGSVELGL